MTQKSLRLDHFLPYRLSVTSNLVSDVIARAYGRLFALSIPEWRLIAVIAESDEGITQQQLIGRTRMDKVTVSRATIALTKRDLLLRSPNPHDGRSQLLRLSGSGRQLYKDIVPRALDLETRIFEEIDSDALDHFVRLLETISNKAEQLLGQYPVQPGSTVG